MAESMPAFDKKIRETGPRTPSKKDSIEVRYPSLTGPTAGAGRLTVEDLVGTSGLEQRSGAQSRLGQADLPPPRHNDEDASDSDMSVDSKGSWQTVDGRRRKQKSKQQQKQKQLPGSKDGEQHDERKDERKEGRKKRPAKANVHAGVEMRDLQGLQKSLASVEMTLRAVLEGIGEDRSRKRSSACQKLSGEVERAATIVAALQAGMATERLRASVERIEKEKRADDRKDGRDAALEGRKRSWSSVVRDGRSAPSIAQVRPAQRIEWDAERTVILRPVDPSLATQEISAFAFGHELERFLHPLLGAGGSEDSAVQRLVRTPTGDWKLMVAPAVREYVLASPNVRVKDTLWKIEKLRAAPLPSMVVTGVPLELSDVEVKEGLVAGAKRVLPREAARDLARLEARRLFVRPRERRAPPGGPETRETGELARGATASVDSATQSDARPTRSVRVFAPPALIDRFLQNGHVSIRWSVHSVRQYTPTQYYCKMCQRMGSHSTKYHRGGTAQKGAKNNP